MSSPAGTKACKTRCMQEMVLSLKGELRVTQDCLRATQERLEQQQRNAEELKKDQESCKEKLMLVGKKVGDDTTIAQDACIRSWYCGEKVTQWVTRVTGYSSQYTTTFGGVKHIRGSPDVYPRYGYIDDRYNLNQWIPDTSDDGPWNEIEWIELEYDGSLLVNRVDVYETLNAGGVRKILYRNEPNDPWTVLYSADEIVAVPEPTILSVVPEGAAVNMKYIRLEIDQSVAGPLDNNLVGIDAVSMTGTGDCSMTCAGP